MLEINESGYFATRNWIQDGPVYCILHCIHPGHTGSVCGTDLNLSVLSGAQRQQSVSKEGLELDGAAGGCDHMDHLHARCSGPTALHTLLSGITFVAQHIPGEEVMEVRMMKIFRDGWIRQTRRKQCQWCRESQHNSYLNRGFSMMCSLRLNASSWS